MIAAGDLDRRITIRRATTVINPGTGLPVETWGDLTTVWASWRRATARETLAAAELSAQVTDIFTVRWSSVTATITPMDRVLYQGREYDLAEVTEIGRREGIILRGAARVSVVR